MNAKLVAVSVLALVAGALLALQLWGPTPQTQPTSGHVGTTGKALVGGPFNLLDSKGKRVSDQDFRGRYMLVFFGFTYCPDVCPSGLQVITAALDKMGPAADQITPVFITIDPARDTPDKMGAYVASFHPRLVGLTGSAEEIASVVKAYRVYAKKVPDARNPQDYTMDHSSIAYLMGPNGELVSFSAELLKADVLAEQLKKGLATKG